MATLNQTVTLDSKTYRQYSSMLKKAAWDAQTSYGVDYEDALSKAHEIFVDAVLSYDFGKAKFSTHLTTRLLSLSHMANPRSAENQSHFANILMSSPVADRDGDKEKTLECKIGTPDAAFASKDLLDWMSKCSTEDSRVLAWQIVYGEINHDKANYILNADVVERRPCAGRPKKGEVVVKEGNTKMLPINTDITVMDAYNKWSRAQGWSLSRTALAFNDLKFVLNQLKGV